MKQRKIQWVTRKGNNSKNISSSINNSASSNSNRVAVLIPCSDGNGSGKGNILK